MILRLRKASLSDVPALHDLIDISVRELQKPDYTPEQIESALQKVFGVDTQLIADGTYFVAEAEERGELPIMVGCGGWSKRKTLYGADQWTGREDTLLDPKQDAAKIRAFFVHPDWTRKGIGTLILQACENAAMVWGFTRFEMGATLTGVPLYRSRGYVSLENVEVPLEEGLTLPIVKMEKKTRLVR